MVKCDNRTIIYEKRKIESTNVTKGQSHVIFGTAQFEDGTIKCQKKYEYNRTLQKYHSVYFGTLNKNEKRQVWLRVPIPNHNLNLYR